MERTTIMIPSDLKRKALLRARKMGISFGELVRRALEEVLSNEREESESDPFFSDKAVFKGAAPGDIAEKHAHYLYGVKE